MPLRISHDVLTAALAEATRRGDGIIHPENLLVAVADAAILRPWVIDGDRVRSQVDQLLGPPVPPIGRGGINDTTSRILGVASERAQRRNAESATSDDVLFGLLDETDGPQIAPALLREAGVDVDALRRALL